MHTLFEEADLTVGRRGVPCPATQFLLLPLSEKSSLSWEREQGGLGEGECCSPCIRPPGVGAASS